VILPWQGDIVSDLEIPPAAMDDLLPVMATLADNPIGAMTEDNRAISGTQIAFLEITAG
jgi:hypothetical protein